MLKPINWQKVAEHVENGYINVQKHLELDLWLYNYSRSCQYNSAWDNETLQCRGLVVDINKNVISAALPKFWSYEQLLSYRSHTWASHILRKLDNKEPFTVQDKMDGSYISIFKYKNRIIAASRGSFVSTQAIKALEIINDKYKNFEFEEGVTYLAEIIY
jgi:RNA ligase